MIWLCVCCIGRLEHDFVMLFSLFILLLLLLLLLLLVVCFCVVVCGDVCSCCVYGVHGDILVSTKFMVMCVCVMAEWMWWWYDVVLVVYYVVIMVVIVVTCCRYDDCIHGDLLVLGNLMVVCR